MVLSREIRAANTRERLCFLNDKQKDFINRVLTDQQRNVVTDSNDLIYVAALENLMRKNLDFCRKFDKTHNPSNLVHYMQIQSDWIREEEYLVGTRVGGTPSQNQICEDFNEYKNGLRFKLFYFFKYSELFLLEKI